MVTKTPTIQDIETAERELLQIVDAGIKAIVAAHDVNIQKNRYKAMQAIAFQAFIEHIEAGDFDALVERASANVGTLPSGWEIKAPEKAAPTPKPAAKKPAPGRATTR